jgi:murein DD-endopeptidase MepM/ murein hydrolase activator NlpD
VLTLLFCAAPAGAANVQSAKKNWRYPVSGAHNYGDLADTGFGVLRPDGSRHTGQDILAECGTPVRAVHDGKVLSRGYSTGYGFYVVLDALGSGLDFAYGHLKNTRLPRRNKMVRKGQRIGFVGMTGTDSGTCHLHFELWHGHWLKGKRTDPLPRLKLWDRFS